jgi:hypothetical protein
MPPPDEFDTIIEQLAADPVGERTRLERIVVDGEAHLEVASRIAPLVPAEEIADARRSVRTAKAWLAVLDGLRDGTIRKERGAWRGDAKACALITEQDVVRDHRPGLDRMLGGLRLVRLKSWIRRNWWKRS